jgi:zinc transport system substrate-binding protein
MDSKQKTLMVTGIVVMLALLIAVWKWQTGSPTPPQPETSGSPTRVVASFYPLAEFSSAIGGASVSVTNVTPAGVEPHDFEPSPRDVADAHSADLFVYNGAGMDAWAQRLAPSLETKGIVTLDLSQSLGIELLAPPDEEEELERDPHVWLDPILAARQVEIIRDALVSIDPGHAEEYRRNADAYLAQLSALDREYRDGLASCQLRTVITSHAAFGYLAKRYGFTQLSITGLSPDEEPSPKALSDLADLARKTGVRYVFFEELVNPALAQALSREIGAQTLAFNPLEGLTQEQIASGETYISVMRENLAALRTALSCR